jgi:hypothetical protein
MSASHSFSVELAHFQPHILGRFGNTSIAVALTNNASLHGRGWYNADANAAFVAVVNLGEHTISFTCTVMQRFNPRMVFATFTATVGAWSKVLHCVPASHHNNSARGVLSG